MSSPEVSSKSYTIAGIQTTVYGLDEVSSSATSLACLWLLHPRLQVQSLMAPIAAAAIHDWNSRRTSKGLIAVSFNQRNHGDREVNSLANESWKKGNPTHAQDMFSIFHGTAQDTSLLLDYISSYIFPSTSLPISQNLVLGISLGGHAAWQCLVHDPRITAGVVVIGCPDYSYLMSDRAKKSKLESYTSSNGSGFFGSADFPKGLVETVGKWDPKALLMGSSPPSQQEKTLLKDRLGGKHILCLSGGQDKLVPYFCSAPFLDYLKAGLDKQNGWFNNQGTTLEDIVDDTAGHEYSDKMKVEAIRFISETLAGDGGLKSGTKTSKI